MNRILTAFFVLVFAASAVGQNIPLYKWRSHLPYGDGLQVVEAGQKIYCVTATGFYYFDKSDNSIHALSKVDGFADVQVKAMAYNQQYDILMIAYQNGNIDEVHAGKVTNFPVFINQFAINNIYISPDGSKGYLALNAMSASYGVYEWDFGLNIQGDFYNCNSQPNIYRLTIAGNYLYACSDSGVKRILVDYPNKNDLNAWESISNDSCGNVVTVGGKVMGSFQYGIMKYYNEGTGTWVTMHRDQLHHPIRDLESTNNYLTLTTLDSSYVYNADLSGYDSIGDANHYAGVMDADGILWIGKNIYGMLSHRKGGTFGFYQPGGKPTTVSGNHGLGYKNQVWFSAGVIKSSGAPGFDNHGFYMFDGENWHNYNSTTNFGNPANGNLDTRDFMGMAFDTITGHLWIATLDSGIMEFDPASQRVIAIYSSANTNKGILPEPWAKGHTGIQTSDVKFDESGNLWASIYSDYQAAQNQILEKKRNGAWSTFTAGPMQNVNGIIVDEYGYIWMIDTKADNNGGGLIIFDPVHKLTTSLIATAGSGGLPSQYVTCGVKDKNGEIWIGTTAGPCVYSDPSLLFTGKTYDVQRPYISNGNNAGYLLNSISISCIAVDGANRKWYGSNEGVWLTSPEGDKIIEHFDVTNSPLVSNNITAIAINGSTGEVFFASDKGIVSYRDAATDGGNTNQQVYAFPNPVKPGYSGPITIRGLVTNANVKITDITGTLVYETTALGGEATWDGKNFSGRAANSGVYLVLITNSDGSQTAITKIMIVR